MFKSNKKVSEILTTSRQLHHCTNSKLIRVFPEQFKLLTKYLINPSARAQAEKQQQIFVDGLFTIAPLEEE